MPLPMGTVFRRGLVSVVLTTPLLACAIETSGLAEAPETTVDADGGVTGRDRPTSATGVSYAVPPGWSLVAYAEGDVACPAGFGANAHELVTGPAPGEGACACETCAPATAPSCTTGPVALTYDTDGTRTCTTVGVGLTNKI